MKKFIFAMAIFVLIAMGCESPILPGEEEFSIAVSRGGSATSATVGMLSFFVTPSGATLAPAYDWHLNEGSLPAAALLEGDTLRLPASDLAPGTYSIAVDATSGDALSSASFVIEWQGSLAAAPADPEIGWAYYDTTTALPYYWDGSAWLTFYSELVLTVAASGADYTSIQAAIAAPYPDGFTVSIAVGTYDGTVDITRRVSLVGAGSGVEGTILVNTAAQGDFVNLPAVNGITYGAYRPSLIVSASGIAASPILIKDLRIGERANIGYPRPGILLRPGSASDRIASYSYISLDNVHAVGLSSAYAPGSFGPP